jgi:hypothetical protein
MSLEKRVAGKGSSSINAWQSNNAMQPAKLSPRTTSKHASPTPVKPNPIPVVTTTAPSPISLVSELYSRPSSASVPSPMPTLVSLVAQESPTSDAPNATAGYHKLQQPRKVVKNLGAPPPPPFEDNPSPSPPPLESAPSDDSGSGRFSPSAFMSAANSPIVGVKTADSTLSSGFNLFAEDGSYLAPRAPPGLAPPPGFADASPSPDAKLLGSPPLTGIDLAPSMSPRGSERRLLGLGRPGASLSSDPWAAAGAGATELSSSSFRPPGLGQTPNNDTTRSDLLLGGYTESSQLRGSNTTIATLSRLSSLSQSNASVGDSGKGSTFLDPWRGGNINGSDRHLSVQSGDFNVENFVLNFLDDKDGLHAAEEAPPSHPQGRRLSTDGSLGGGGGIRLNEVSPSSPWDRGGSGDVLLSPTSFGRPVGSSITSEWGSLPSSGLTGWGSQVDVDSAAVAPLGSGMLVGTTGNNGPTGETGDSFGNRRSAFFASLVRDVVDENSDNDDE